MYTSLSLLINNVFIIAFCQGKNNEKMQYIDVLCRKHRHMGDGGVCLGNTIKKVLW